MKIFDAIREVHLRKCLLLLALMSFAFCLTGCGGSGAGEAGGGLDSPSAGGKSGTGGSRVMGTLSDESGAPIEGTVRDLVGGNETRSAGGVYELNGIVRDSSLGAFLLEVVLDDGPSDTFELPFERTERVDITADFTRRGDSIDAEFEVSLSPGGSIGNDSGKGKPGADEDFSDLLGTKEDDLAAEESKPRTPESSEKEAEEEIDLGGFTAGSENKTSQGEGDFNF